MQESRKELVKKVAEERIGLLFKLADDNAKDHPDFSHNYVVTLRKISSHYKVPVPKTMKDRICTHCNSVLVPGLNATVRIVSSKGYIAYKCSVCRKERHIFY